MRTQTGPLLLSPLAAKTLNCFTAKPRHSLMGPLLAPHTAPQDHFQEIASLPIDINPHDYQRALYQTLGAEWGHISEACPAQTEQEENYSIDHFSCDMLEHDFRVFKPLVNDRKGLAARPLGTSIFSRKKGDQVVVAIDYCGTQQSFTQTLRLNTALGEHDCQESIRLQLSWHSIFQLLQKEPHEVLKNRFEDIRDALTPPSPFNTHLGPNHFNLGLMISALFLKGLIPLHQTPSIPLAALIYGLDQLPLYFDAEDQLLVPEPLIQPHFGRLNDALYSGQARPGFQYGSTSVTLFPWGTALSHEISESPRGRSDFLITQAKALIEDFQ